MTILVVADAHAPLSQGDVLRFSGLLSWTGRDGGPNSKRDVEFVLVISRNCRAIRAARVLVCPIIKTRLVNDGLGATYKEAKEHLSSIRDGAGSPDRFYIGELDDTGHRYAAHLDEIYLIELPTAEGDRSEYVEKHRLWSLDRDFIYDLHARLFNSFARQGFGDESWYSDGDLDLLIELATVEDSSNRMALAQAKVSLSKAKSDPQAKPKQTTSLVAAVANAEENVKSSGAELAKLQAERARRSRPQGHGSSPQ